MLSASILFLERINFELKPMISPNSYNQDSIGIIIFVAIIGIVLVAAPILIGRLQNKARGLNHIPQFNKENFFSFAAKSGLSHDAAKYLFQNFKAQQNNNPMSIFFNYTSMLQIFKAIYQVEKTKKAKDPVKFQENISYLIDAIDVLEEHFQSVSSVLSTYLIPQNTKVFLSDLKNSFRIPMSVNRSTPRTLILNYRFDEKDNEERLHKAGRQLVLWLLDSNSHSYAAYNVRLKKIRNYSSTSRKEYFVSHSWRQEIPNITRRHKRVHLAQRVKIKPLSSSGKGAALQPRPAQANAVFIDISLGGCHLILNPKYQELFVRGQEVQVICNNPLAKIDKEGSPQAGGDTFFSLDGRIARITNSSDKSHDELCNIHIKFRPLQRNTKNNLGLFIYGLETVYLPDSSPNW